MLHITEPQIGTVIGVLATALVGMITLTTQLMMRSLTTQITGLSREVANAREYPELKFDLKTDQVAQRLDRLEGRLNGVDGRLDKVEQRFDSLDRDVQAIARKVASTEHD